MSTTEKRAPRKRGPRRGRPNRSGGGQPRGRGRKPENKRNSTPGVPLSEEKRIYDRAEPMAAIEMNCVFALLIPELQHALSATGYTTPTPVQTQAIPPQIEGKDLLGSAQTGTGKTAAFTLPLLQKLSTETHRAESHHPRALILAPTRELAAQIGESIETYGKFLPVTYTVIYGGVGQGSQETAMNRGIDILVATPGRLLDLMNQGFIKLDAIKTFVLDEADRMLDMGFIPDIKRILAKLPKDRQTAFFSATLAPEIVFLANSMLVNPVQITIDPEQPTVDKINQRVLFVDREYKSKLLVSILNEPDVDRVIVFAQMKHMANRVCDHLTRSGINAAPIHGDRTQAARMKALEGFRKGTVKVLVATDIAARGIDVDGITHVINYDLPAEPQTYVHRIGRTARAGRHGHALSFCSSEERGLLKDIERLIKKRVPTDIDHAFHSDRAFHAVGVPSRAFPAGGGKNNLSKIPPGGRSFGPSRKSGFGRRRRRK